jgi:transcriptional regulator with XRE-family HTH domain
MAKDIQFSEWLYEQMQGKWSQADLARAAGIRPSTINKILNSKTKRPDPESLCKIADALGISRITVFQAAKILLPEPEFPEKYDLVMTIAQLSTQKRLEMLAFARILLEFTKKSHSEAQG